MAAKVKDLVQFVTNAAAKFYFMANMHEYKTTCMARGFILLDGDIDQDTLVRRFSGRLTKARYKAINRYCRRHTWRQNCSHEWDCCGCTFAEYLHFEYKQNQVSVFMTIHRNY